ncbi:MAG: LamG-like jellyroll fold domain-containing protein [Kiritimatiellia bacterium]
MQFFNVYQNDGSGYNADLVGAAMDDFRIYTEVLDAATIAAYASEFPVFVRRDENDSAVDVWMRFDGDSAQDGLDDIGISSSSAWAGTYETSRQGKALKTSKDSYSSATGVDFGDGDWTLVLSARAQVVTDGQPTCLWTFGKKQDTANTLGFFATEGGLMVSTWSNQSLAEAPIFNLTDAKLAKSINTYALVYTKATGALELFLNGVSQGSVPAPATAAIQGQVTWQLVSLYNGVFGSLTRYNYTGAVDDFRLYKKALTTTEVQTVAAANRPYPSLDENTVRPAYWYMFDGNLSAEGSRSWTVGGNSAVTYKTEDNGIQALDISVTHPYGTGISFGDSGWTVVLRAMGEATDNAVIMGLGDRRSNNAFAFVMGGKSSFTVATWTYPGNDTDVVGHEHLFNVTVFNAHRQYHDYALVYEPPTSTEEDATGTLTLYVDGKNRGSVAKTLNMEGQWQIGSVYSGPAQVELVRSSASRVDDFRLYTEVLTAEQIGRIAAANPVWPYYSIPFSIILR